MIRKSCAIAVVGRKPLPLFFLSVLLGPARLVRMWHRRARQRAELADLGIETLRDVGITPYDAKWEAGKPFWRE